MSLDSSRSTKSERTNSHDESNNNNKKKKKPNQNQKTLGMAWGSNSLSSSKSKSSSSRNSNFPDFSSYMAVKNHKLQHQFDAEAASNSSDSATKPLFHGVSIFVDGFTVPSSQELRAYMVKYGGRFENYFSRSRVTHIICSNLPDSKVKNIRSFSRGLPVVKPTWVLDSVVANKILNWVPYQLDQLVNEAHKQPKLSTFFTPKTNSRLDYANTPANCDMKFVEGSLFKGAVSEKAQLCEVGEIVEDSQEFQEDIAIFGQDKSLEVITEKPISAEEKVPEEDPSCEVVEDSPEFQEEISGHEKSYEVITKEPTSVEEKVSELKEPGPCASDQNVVKAIKSSPSKSSASSPCNSLASANDCLRDPNVKISYSPQIAPSSDQCHSTLGDPNFVENYFKNSRLHFIGTWRNRYRKRFPSLPSSIKQGTVNASGITRGTAIIHIDMDCFFVSVVIRNHPELQDKPVAVCHSNNPRGTAEISSANYPARDYGVRAGMFVRDAKALCPHLVILPYNFEAYEMVADTFYHILHRHCSKVQAVSCDEAFLDVTDREDEDAVHIASIIRHEIFEATGCTASAGISGNSLMARLATRTAKPNGQFFISPEKVEGFLEELPIKALPGIGHVLEEKLKRLQIQTCQQLRMISKESLQKDFGLKTGDMLWNYSRGIDSRPVGAVQETKSVGAEVNWGVRFNSLQDSQRFLVKLCNEVSLRLQGCGVQGRTFTLKLKKKRKDAGEPTKYMGCGDCENLSHSMTIPSATDDVDVLQRISKQLFGDFYIDVKEIRGIGLQVSKLENADIASQGHERKSLRSWLSSASTSMEEPIYSSKEGIDGAVPLLDGQCSRGSTKLNSDGGYSKFPKIVTGPYRGHTNQHSGEASLSEASSLPNICDLDIGVIKSLPPEIFSEMNEMYGGQLSHILEKSEDKDYIISDSVSNSLIREAKGERNKGKELLPSDQIYLEKSITKNKGEQGGVPNCQSASTSLAGSLNLHTVSAGGDQVDVMPTSLSQIDISVLQQLPDELKVDILELLPAHRKPDCSESSLVQCSRDEVKIKIFKDHFKEEGSVSKESLWVGNPPEWVDKFEVSNHLILNLLADLYYKSGSPSLLSSILQSISSVLPLFADASNNTENDVISSLTNLLQQYIDLKIKSDMEEIYICFRLLRRYTTKSRVVLQLYNTVLPYLQDFFHPLINIWLPLVFKFWTWKLWGLFCLYGMDMGYRLFEGSARAFLCLLRYYFWLKFCC